MILHLLPCEVGDITRRAETNQTEKESRIRRRKENDGSQAGPVEARGTGIPDPRTRGVMERRRNQSPLPRISDQEMDREDYDRIRVVHLMRTDQWCNHDERI